MSAVDELLLMSRKEQIASTVLKMTYIELMELADDFASWTYSDEHGKTELVPRNDMAGLIHDWASETVNEFKDNNPPLNSGDETDGS